MGGCGRSAETVRDRSSPGLSSDSDPSGCGSSRVRSLTLLLALLPGGWLSVADSLLAKVVTATCGPAVAQIERTVGCAVSTRKSPPVALLTGMWRARRGMRPAAGDPRADPASEVDLRPVGLHRSLATRLAAVLATVDPQAG